MIDSEINGMQLMNVMVNSWHERCVTIGDSEWQCVIVSDSGWR